MTVTLVIPGPADTSCFATIAEGVFDNAIDPRSLAAFLQSPSHHMVLATDGATVVGMVSANSYLHPDKPEQLWINEIGVAPSHRRRGIGRALLTRILEHLASLGFDAVWAATEHDNDASRALFASVGAKATEGVVMLEMSTGGGAS